ncbi:MAG: DegV family protein with EDD domain [Desulforhopalus sp.]|jgi:DegV family protein with EDD domain
MSDLNQSFGAGYACLSAWANLLDRINVFPVADGDTGTNLRISLAPFRDCENDCKTTYDLLARSATGNSGNIAAAFFREFCQAENYGELAEKTALGNEKAWQSITNPRAGTMLTVFGSLARVLASPVELHAVYTPLRLELQKAVRDTSQLLPELKSAGVVDSGALAMFVFFDGFFRNLTQQEGQPGSILDIFAGKLVINSSFRPEMTDFYCVDLVIQSSENHAMIKGSIAELGESVVVVEDDAMLKVHLHTPDPDQLRGQLGSFGEITHWSAEEIDQGRGQQYSDPVDKSALHIVTDAAGSITREMARKNGVTLLDSYIVAADNSRPESLYSPAELYHLMRGGGKVTTAQASTFERHQHYQSICQQFGRSLYLVVGSAFTGNFETVMAWKSENDPENLLTVIDTGAASGRLGLIALLTARQAQKSRSAEGLIDFAQKVIGECEEFVFIDELKYLVAGGRVSRAGGFFGDLLSMKPVISPTSDGVRKVGVVHSRKGQLAFALEKLGGQFSGTAAPVIMLQYSDNEEWVTSVAFQQVRALLPEAEILLAPLSLTSGVHMGPGTWSMAYCSVEILNGKSSL